MEGTRVRFVDRVLNAISQAEPRLCHCQKVFPVMIVGSFVREIDTGASVGAILIFLTRNFAFPEIPLHCDKSGTALAFRLGRKSTARVPQKSVLSRWPHRPQMDLTRACIPRLDLLNVQEAPSPAMTSARVVKLSEIWGHQKHPKADQLPPELFALLERRMSTSSRRAAYAAVHVPVPEHRVHRPGAGR